MWLLLLVCEMTYDSCEPDISQYVFWAVARYRTRVSRCRERFRLRLETEWRANSKSETTWCGMLCESSSRIRYSPESTQGAVARTASRTIPIRTATRTSSTSNTMMMAGGSTRIGATPTILWNPDNRFVFVLRHSLRFSPHRGEFCFWSCPFHPPSMRPISSVFSESAIYFLLSSDFVSHSTIRSSVSVSIFLMASRTMAASPAG